MARVIPNFINEREITLPSWLDPYAIVEAAKGKESGQVSEDRLQKTASVQTTDTKVISYSCATCRKIYPLEAAALKSQANLAKRSNIEVNYTCPKCSSVLVPYKSIRMIGQVDNRHSDNVAVEKDLQKEASTNSYVDKLVILKSLSALSKFASKMGMHGATAHYKRADHITLAGQEYPIANNIECDLQWSYGQRQTGRATATISVDVAGNFVFPTVFKIGNKEIPFTKEAVKDAEKTVDFRHPLQSRRQTDQPHYRPSDPSRANVVTASQRVYAELDDSSNYEANGYMPTEQYAKTYNGPVATDEDDEKWGDIEEGRLSGLEMSQRMEDAWLSYTDEISDNLAWRSSQRRLKAEGKSYSKTVDAPLGKALSDKEFVEKYADEYDDYDDDEMIVSSLVQKSSAAYNSFPAGRLLKKSDIPAPLNPNQQVKNPVDGKTYTVKTVTPGQGITVTDPTTNQDTVVTEENAKNLVAPTA